MWFPSLLLLMGSVFFVAAEYAMVSARRSKVDALARQGNKNARALGKALDHVSTYVAASQVGITMVSIGIGSITEPYVTSVVGRRFEQVGFLRDSLGIATTRTIGFVISFIAISFVLVVVGELFPKYLSLRRPEQMAFLLFRPMTWISLVLAPIVWAAQKFAGLLLIPFGVRIDEHGSDAVEKDELLLLVQAGEEEGVLERTHADLLTRALRLDALHARDIMIHRLDIKWVDSGLDKRALLDRLKEIPFSRLPVCRGDIDDQLGILYIHDVVKSWDDEPWVLANLIRPAVAVPENLSLDRIVETMRAEKTQMLMVLDEYGGTSGLITLEDVVEEVFGELEDRIESERPMIESFADGRISARSEVRLDELLGRFKWDIHIGDDTRTLAQMITDELERVPRPGDAVDSVIGNLRVENMARRRITRVTVRPKPALLSPKDD